MNKGAAKGPIDRFLSDAERRLRRHLTADRLQAVLDEAKGHFTERKQELVDSGLEPSKAELKSVAQFGRAGEWSRSIIGSYYADGLTYKARWAVGCSAAVLFIISTLTTFVSYDLSIVPAVVLAVGAFRARVWSSRTFVLLGFCTALVSFFVYGLTMVSIVPGGLVCPRSEAPEMAKSMVSVNTQLYENAQSEVRLLQIGLSTYQPNGSIRLVPGRLRSNGAFIVPLPDSEFWNLRIVLRSAFKDTSNVKWRHVTTPTLAVLEADMPYRTVPTAAEAEHVWRTQGPFWLEQEQETVSVSPSVLAQLRQSAKPPAGFDAVAGITPVVDTSFTLLLLLALDRIAANVGRLTYRIMQRRNRRLAG